MVKCHASQVLLIDSRLAGNGFDWITPTGEIMDLGVTETAGCHAFKMCQMKQSDDHHCLIYETDAEHSVFMSQFISEGLEHGEKVIYIAGGSNEDQIMHYLRKKGGSAETCLMSGQLSVFTVNEFFLCGGFFDPGRTIALLQNELERALSDGYLGLRATGDMTWSLDRAPGSGRLIEYENRLNDFSSNQRCTVICQYDQRRFPPSILMHAILAHPFVGMGLEVHKNPYYTRAPAFLEEEDASVTLSRCLKELTECEPEAQVSS